MVPYLCEVCNLWHLSPMDRSVAHSITCYGKVSGKILTQYDTNQDAKSTAAYVLEEHPHHINVNDVDFGIYRPLNVKRSTPAGRVHV